MKDNIRSLIRKKRLFFDGGTGTVLQGMGLRPGQPPELLNLESPETIVALHRAYLEAGCDIIKTNTFGIHRLKYENYRELIAAGLACAREAVRGYENKYIAYDIGPIGRLLQPLGDLPFEEAVSVFADSLRMAEEGGADLILIETMNDSYETKAAVLAAKEVTSLPIFVTNAYDESGKLMTGASPAAMVALLEGLGVDALGANCSFGPDKMAPIAKELLTYASVPVILNPNAGLPSVKDGKTVFNIGPDDFAAYMKELAEMGVHLLGGCCGTTPDHIRAARAVTEALPFTPPTEKELTLVSSYTHAVILGDDPRLIGERINPTGKPKLKEALRNADMGYLLNEAVRQADMGVHILDVNVGLPGIDEPIMMAEAVKEIQTVTDLPLQIDSSDPAAIETALRLYNGKALVNSVNGEPEKLAAILPLVKKYGGTLVALTMDEHGIPDTAEGRLAIALRIAEAAATYGIKKKDIVVDPLALSVSSDGNSANVTLAAVKAIREAGFRTVLGVSNISFGLPAREKINAAFFTQALANGLSCAIMNPFASTMMDAYYAFRALRGLDVACADYIAYADTNTEAPRPVTVAVSDGDRLRFCVLKGMAEEARAAASVLLATEEPLSLIDKQIVPALNEIGLAFEQKKAYLPQLLMSAEAASAAFGEIKKHLPAASADGSRAVILATVKGDIHDIGKNIVKVLLESYGFTVHDLGRDVPPETIRDFALSHNVSLVGLSALMTTTVPAMAKTIALLREASPEIRGMV
ncbi:MAG: homocysteine S-methyltransferase family protein, partial [Clostridia bacterium]|nr:homocysteine S-methyltransferase family protein [Clostridia bacterium]